MIRSISIAVMFACLLALAAAAADFSAEMVARSGKGREMTSKMYFTGQKMRTEAMGSVSIMRMDKNLMWNIMPGQKVYMEMKIPTQSRAGMSNKAPGELKREKLGRETVNGFGCDKYKVTYKDPDTGKTSSMYQWITSDSIPVKSEALDGSWSSEIKKMSKGPQPSSLFEIPAGYKKMAMPMGMGMGGRGMSGKAGKAPADYMKMMPKDMQKMMRDGQ